ncbi:MAG: hypothetical protein V3U60_16475 [Gammaproteobacteria bacterium]
MTDIPTKFPPGEFIQEELDARGWTTADLASRMGGDAAQRQCCVEILIYAPNKGVILDDDTASGLSRAFGTSAEFWINLDRDWRGNA